MMAGWGCILVVGWMNGVEELGDLDLCGFLIDLSESVWCLVCGEEKN